jgi:hypothetical protein
MTDETQQKKLSLEELMVRTEAAVKLLIEKRVFTDTEFKAHLSMQRAMALI